MSSVAIFVFHYKTIENSEGTRILSNCPSVTSSKFIDGVCNAERPFMKIENANEGYSDASDGQA